MQTGACGQGIYHVNVKLGWVVALLGLAGCGSGDARYVGPVATDQGSCGLGFDAAGRASATLIVRQDEATFYPSSGAQSLLGHVTNVGHVATSSTTTGADRKPFLQVFEGDVAGDRVSGKFATPRCRASVELTRR